MIIILAFLVVAGLVVGRIWEIAPRTGNTITAENDTDSRSFSSSPTSASSPASANPEFLEGDDYGGDDYHELHGGGDHTEEGQHPGPQEGNPHLGGYGHGELPQGHEER